MNFNPINLIPGVILLVILGFFTLIICAEISDSNEFSSLDEQCKEMGYYGVEDLRMSGWHQPLYKCYTINDQGFITYSKQIKGGTRNDSYN